MVGFYKHDIPAWMDGTEALSDGAYRAYHVIVQLIMLNEGPIALNERGIAGRCNCTVKALARALDELVAAGKLAIEDGRIHNRRAGQELESVMKNRENAGKGGKTRAIRAEIQKSAEEPRHKSLKTNDAPQAALENISSLKEKRREESPIVPKGTDPEGFAEFWQAYPRRDGDNPRKPAIRAYAKVIRGGADPAAILKAVQAYASDLLAKGKIGTEFVPLATTWLNQARFERFTASPDAQPSGGQLDLISRVAGITDEAWRDRVRAWKGRGGYWPWQQSTEPPDDPKTRVPRHILAEFGIGANSTGDADRKAA